MNETDLATGLLRCVLGVILLAHGWNHWRGGGRIAGTARWFGGLGLRPPIVHAWSSVVVELAAGTALVLGLLTSLACAAAVGVMTVAGIAAHRRNGFFVFNEGYEYVLLVAVVSASLATIGPGAFSLDHVLGLDVALDGWTGGGIALTGVAGAAAMLAVCWRPQRKVAAEEAAEARTAVIAS